jgi:hypothetical protein
MNVCKKRQRKVPREKRKGDGGEGKGRERREGENVYNKEKVSKSNQNIKRKKLQVPRSPIVR